MEYKLSNEKLTVTLKALSGALRSIQTRDGMEYLWQGDQKYWSGQAPILFPICGSIRDDQAQIGDGLVTAMPRHGLVRRLDFQCEEQEKDHIRFGICSTEEMYQKYPYRFHLHIDYRLIDNTIWVTYFVDNLDDKVMPYFIGGHPAFRCPMEEGETFEDYYVEFEEKETCSIPTPVVETGLIDMEHRTELLEHENILPLSHDLFTVDAVILDRIQSKRASLCSKKSRRRVDLGYADFKYLVLWSSANRGPFLAMEPWTGLSTCSDEGNRFEDKRNVKFIKPGEKDIYTYTITIQE